MAHRATTTTSTVCVMHIFIIFKILLLNGFICQNTIVGIAIEQIQYLVRMDICADMHSGQQCVTKYWFFFSFHMLFCTKWWHMNCSLVDQHVNSQWRNSELLSFWIFDIWQVFTSRNCLRISHASRKKSRARFSQNKSVQTWFLEGTPLPWSNCHALPSEDGAIPNVWQIINVRCSKQC